MTTQALIIFVRNPQLGKVKTRLAQTTGNQKALEIYLQLLHHTRHITKNIAADKFVFYNDYIDTNDLWENNIYNKQLQAHGDLGYKMLDAFKTLIHKKYESVVIIGSDCMELDEHIINEAFEKLKTHNVVIGPAYDGGYYLLGTNNLIPEIFNDIAWSTNEVCSQTINILKTLNKSYALLNTLNDIDTEADWNNYLQNLN
jgi:uncharacterized protein